MALMHHSGKSKWHGGIINLWAFILTKTDIETSDGMARWHQAYRNEKSDVLHAPVLTSLCSPSRYLTPRTSSARRTRSLYLSAALAA